jgi:predicted GH43/DUF377 family glycosyl hydrolase
MPLLQRHPENPIFRPNPQNEWEEYAAFNGSVIKEKDVYYMAYRAMSEEKQHEGRKLRLSTIGLSTSPDGIHFDNRSLFIKPEHKWEKFGCEDPRITKIDGQFLIFYTAVSSFPPNASSIKCAVALSKDLSSVSEKHLVTPFNAKAMTMFPEKINGMYTVFLSVNTDSPPTNIACAQFSSLETLWDQGFWSEWYANLDKHILNVKRVNSDQVEIGAPPLKTEYGWLLLYSYIKNYYSNANATFRIEAVLLDKDNPRNIIGRVDEPCLVPQEPYELTGQINDVVFPEGALIEDNTLKLYYGAADSYCCLATATLDEFLQHINLNSAEAIKCERFANNPLLKPIAEHAWESKAVYNPAALEINGTVYLVYRGQSEEDICTFGLAVSQDGLYIDERLPDPIYKPRTKWEISSTKHNYGCEDPRLTIIDDRIYMCYTAHDSKLPRLAFTSITIADFLGRKWSGWAVPKVISPPNIADKDGCLFPEKIGGKYVFFHRIEPSIVMDYVDSLDFADGKSLDSSKVIYPRSKNWDGVKVGINTPPLKTEAGWLVFYHGISKADNHYRLGALLLDLDDVSVIKARSPYPILEPETYFEREGLVNNVVFPCGYVLKGDEIYLYYGGADKVVCGAKISLNSLLKYLINSTTTSYLKLGK